MAHIFGVLLSLFETQEEQACNNVVHASAHVRSVSLCTNCFFLLFFSTPGGLSFLATVTTRAFSTPLQDMALSNPGTQEHKIRRFALFVPHPPATSTIMSARWINIRIGEELVLEGFGREPTPGSNRVRPLAPSTPHAPASKTARHGNQEDN